MPASKLPTVCSAVVSLAVICSIILATSGCFSNLKGAWLPVPVVTAATLDPAQRAALVDLYNSTRGEYWSISSGWGSGDPCEAGWYGVKCDPSHSEVE